MQMNNSIYTIKDEMFGIKVELYGHEARITSHSHDFIELTFVEQGFTMHRVKGEKASLLLPGDLLFILPGMVHEYWKSTNNKVYNCLFYPETLGEDFNVLAGLPLLNQILAAGSGAGWGKTHLSPEYRYSSVELLKKIKTEGSTRKKGWEIRSKALLTELLVNISRAWDKEDNPDAGSFIDEIPYTPYAMIQILENSTKERMNVEDMAAAMGYSPEHFSRIFKKLTGISPMAYLINMRIAAAAEKLMDERLSIAEAAQLAGFDDVNYFSRIFKKETGKTPSDFRTFY